MYNNYEGEDKIKKEPLFGDKRLNEFDIGEVIGKGAYAIVKLCKEKMTE